MDLNPQDFGTQSNILNTNQPQSNTVNSDDSDGRVTLDQANIENIFQQIFQQEQSDFDLMIKNRYSDYSYSAVNTPEQLPQQYFPTMIGTLNLQNVQQHQNTRPINIDSDSQSQEEAKIASIKNYMPTVAVKAIQSIAEQVKIKDDCQNYKTMKFAEQVQKVANIMLEKVIKIQRTVRKNKTFLLMVYNPVNEELNKKIKAEKMTEAHNTYFKVLNTYGWDLMNAAKKLLIDAFIETMTDQWIREFAQIYPFKTDGPLKQKVLQEYMLEIKFQLREYGKISGRC